MGCPVDAKSTEKLLKEHQHSVSLLKNVVQSHLPDLANKELEDGTKVDDLFYLRYVLSSKKERLTTTEEVQDSKTLKHCLESFKWRKANAKKATTKVNKKMLQKIPLLRTGELSNGFPVLCLPLNKVDLDYVQKNSSNEDFKQELMSFLLDQRNMLFKELDKKTRITGDLIKSITVYDLKGVSFSSIYRLAKFFNLVQSQTKIFKKYFPQSTHSTVIVNSPGSWVLKSFSGSSKQKVMSVKEFLKTYNARQAVPDFMGGSFKWPENMTDMSAGESGYLESDLGSVNKIQMSPIVADTVSELGNDGLNYGNIELNSLKSKKARAVNKKIVLTTLEREMIRMKKNRLFSIDVLDRNQEVNLFFSNMLHKNANILVVVKENVDGKFSQGLGNSEMMSSVLRHSAIITPGFGNMSLKLKNPGEILLVYVDRKKINDSSMGFSGKSVENMKLKRSPAQRALRYGKKVYKRRTRRRRDQYQAAPINIKKLQKMLNQGNSNAEVLQSLRNRGDKSNANFGKVLFRFEVTDAVVCGQYDGEKNLSDSEVETEFDLFAINSLVESSKESKKLQKGLKVNDDGLMDFSDTASQRSSSTLSMMSKDDSYLGRKSKIEEPSFMRSVGQIFGFGNRSW